MSEYAVRMEDYINLERKHVQYVVQGMVPRPGIVTLIGPPFAGKSFLAVQLAHAIAHGGRFLDRDSVKGRVLYLILESELVWRERIKILLECGYLRAGAEIYVPHPDHKPAGVNILSESGRTWIARTIESADPDMVIIDTLRELHSAEENSSTEMKIVGDAIAELVQDRSCIILHHTHRMAPDVKIDPVHVSRGSTYITGKADSVWLLLPKGKKVEDDRADLYIVPRFAEREVISLVRTTRGLWVVS